ncbi:MAG: DUF4097 family beta strand repeat-containing protein [Steroidobacteraceae bacterium]
MRPRPHRFGHAGWLVVLCGALAAPVAWAAERTFDRQFEAGPRAHLTVDADVGSVTVQGRAGREVTVHAEARGSETFLTRLELTAQQSASGITVRVRTAPLWRDWSGWWFWGFGAAGNRLQLTIEVPRDCPLQLSTAGGRLEVRDVDAPVRGSTSGGSIFVADVVGSVEMHTSGGGVHAEHLAGPVVLGTSGGAITVVNASGDLEVHTSGGGILLENIDARIRATTSGGSIRVEALANHGISLGTSGGGVSLSLPARARASIDAWTTGGRVRSELPLSRIDIAEHSRLRGDVNGGGERVVLHTSGGSIKIGELRR